MTLHRPALVDSPTLLLETMSALSEIAATMPVVFPVHPRTRSRLEELGFVAPPQLLLVDPQPYTQFLSLEVGAAAVVTDSGGVQEETTALGIPCFTLRDNTERPVTVTYGNNVLLGLDPARIREVPDLLARHQAGTVPPFWDGAAGSRAAVAIERSLEELDLSEIDRQRRKRAATRSGSSGALNAGVVTMPRRPAE